MYHKLNMKTDTHYKFRPGVYVFKILFDTISKQNSI